MDGAEIANLAELEQDRMLEVIKYHAEGRSKSWIRQKTGVSYQEQDNMRTEFANYATNDSYMQFRARESVAQSDFHYNQIMEKLYQTYDDAVANEDYKVQSTILKQIADVEKQRVDFLHRAGLLGAEGIGDQVAEAESKINAVKSVLKAVASEYPEAAKLISEKLAEMDGTAIPKKVVGQG